jgi:hypothetical protein
MIWLLIAIVGAGTFVFSGISVLSDPFCQSVDFGGGRVIQLTCRDDSFGAFSQTSAGWLSILGGVGILLLIFRRPIIKALSGPQHPKDQRVDPSSGERPFGEGAHQVYLESQEVTTVLDPHEISQETKKCKFCAESINLEAIKCKHCGSSLVPNSSEKIKSYLKTDQGKVVSVISACFLLILSGVFINQSNKAKEMKLLNESGQVCVVGYGEPSLNFGCTKYPMGEIKFCSKAKVLNPFWSERDYDDSDFQGTNFLGRIQGIPGGQIGSFCREPTLPNLFTYKWSTDFRVGTYKLLSVEYQSLEGSDSVDGGGGGGDFVVEISIKK